MRIADDYDGTIVQHAYPSIGKEIPFAIETLKRLQKEEHHLLILWTVRTGKFLDEAIEFCKSKGLEFYAVNQNNPDEEDSKGKKIIADVYIDDRSLGGLPDWGIIYKVLKENLTWKDLYQSTQKKSFFDKLKTKK